MFIYTSIENTSSWVSMPCVNSETLFDHNGVNDGVGWKNNQLAALCK